MKKGVFISKKRDNGSKIHKVDRKNQAEENPLPKLSPQELTANNLWDSDWLREKYPDRFDDDYYADDEMKWYAKEAVFGKDEVKADDLETESIEHYPTYYSKGYLEEFKHKENVRKTE